MCIFGIHSLACPLSGMPLVFKIVGHAVIVLGEDRIAFSPSARKVFDSHRHAKIHMNYELQREALIVRKVTAVSVSNKSTCRDPEGDNAVLRNLGIELDRSTFLFRVSN